jgi:hypothetical protein
MNTITNAEATFAANPIKVNRKRPCKNTEAMFWDNVDKSGGEDACWPWKKSIASMGYGTYCFQRKHRYTHRLAYEFSKGAIPSGLFICHHCDNKLCCNPKHLFAGTQKENVHDCMRKGRNTFGEKNEMSKLTEQQVETIHRLYKEGIFQKDIAASFGVKQTCISKIVLGDRWKHIYKKVRADIKLPELTLFKQRT